MEIVDDSLRKLFRKLGECIGDRPGYFIIVPILISALCASGFQRIVFEADPEYLFSPVDGQVKINFNVLLMGAKDFFEKLMLLIEEEKNDCLFELERIKNLENKILKLRK